MTFTASEKIRRGRYLKLTASKHVAESQAGDDWIGVSLNSAAAGQPVAVVPPQSFADVRASAAITVGDPLEIVGSGNVGPQASGEVVGTAMSSASTDGDRVIVQVLSQQTALRKQVTFLESADILAMGDSPVTIVDAVGEGRTILPVAGVLKPVIEVDVSLGYSFVANVGWFLYRGTEWDAGATSVFPDVNLCLNDMSAPILGLLVVGSGTTILGSQSSSGLIINNEGDNPTSGDFPVEITVLYWDLPATS